MIILKISNSSELISSKLGKFLERLTPDSIDDSLVEDLVVKKMIESLKEEGIKGQISQVNGLELESDKILITEELNIRDQNNF
tara:strand:- start:95 stop:343 length:249 start_codon:yes stop_codon:yes gene_type:complete